MPESTMELTTTGQPCPCTRPWLRPAASRREQRQSSAARPAVALAPDHSDERHRLIGEPVLCADILARRNPPCALEAADYLSVRRNEGNGLRRRAAAVPVQSQREFLHIR